MVPLWIFIILGLIVAICFASSFVSREDDDYQTVEDKRLVFKNGESAYEYSMEYMNNPEELEKGKEYICLVEDSHKGGILLKTQISGEDTLFVARRLDFLGNRFDTLEKGDCVVFVPLIVLPMLGSSSTFGTITAKISNVLILNKGWETEWAFDISPLLNLNFVY